MMVLLIGVSDAHAQVSCMTSISPLNFGAYRPFVNSHTDSVGSISLNCSGNTATTIPYEIRLSPGQSGSIYDRALTGGDNQSELSYQLYVDPGYSIIWGDGVTGASASGLIPSSLLMGTSTKNVYGRIEKQQTVETGTYSDYVVVSVIF